MKYFLFAAFLVGCAPENDVCDGRCPPQVYETRVSDHVSPSFVWICQHTGELCSEDCYVPGDSTKFCWLLTVDDCEVIESEWQELYCPYLDSSCE